jgi:hypothetical protein
MYLVRLVRYKKKSILNFKNRCHIFLVESVMDDELMRYKAPLSFMVLLPCELFNTNVKNTYF